MDGFFWKGVIEKAKHPKEIKKFTTYLFVYYMFVYLVGILQRRMDSFETWYMQVCIEYDMIENE